MHDEKPIYETTIDIFPSLCCPERFHSADQKVAKRSKNSYWRSNVKEIATGDGQGQERNPQSSMSSHYAALRQCHCSSVRACYDKRQLNMTHTVNKVMMFPWQGKGHRVWSSHKNKRRWMTTFLFSNPYTNPMTMGMVRQKCQSLWSQVSLLEIQGDKLMLHHYSKHKKREMIFHRWCSCQKIKCWLTAKLRLHSTRNTFQKCTVRAQAHCHITSDVDQASNIHIKGKNGHREFLGPFTGVHHLVRDHDWISGSVFVVTKSN